MTVAALPVNTCDGLISGLVETAVTLQETALRLEDIALCPRTVPLESDVQHALLLGTTRSLFEAHMLLEAAVAEQPTLPLASLKKEVQSHLREVGQQLAVPTETSDIAQGAVVT